MKDNIFESKLVRQLELEKIVSNIARGFVRIDDIDYAISNALKAIGEFSNASRAYVFKFKENDTLMDNTNEWCKVGVDAEIDNLQNLPTNIFPWWINKIINGEVLDIHDVSDLGDSAKAEKEILEMQNIKSVLVLPISYKDKLQGFVGFDNIESKGVWTEEDQVILSLASEFFSNVFERKVTEDKLNHSNKELEKVVLSLKSAQTQLFQQENMVAIGQLAAGVAHEINNPLGFVWSNHTILKNYVYDLINIIDGMKLAEEKRSEYDFIVSDVDGLVEDINSGLERVKKTINGLRFFSKVDKIEDVELYDIREGIENTLVVISYKLKNKIKIIQVIDNELPLIMVNGGKINQVILNLLINAVDAIEEVGNRNNGVIKIEVNKSEDHIILKITDNGAGMSEDVKKQMFNPFFSTKEIGKGTGLGLNISYDIVNNLHNGKLIVQSEVGVGTEITVKLPII